MAGLADISRIQRAIEQTAFVATQTIADYLDRDAMNPLIEHFLRKASVVAIGSHPKATGIGSFADEATKHLCEQLRLFTDVWVEKQQEATNAQPATDAVRSSPESGQNEVAGSGSETAISSI